MGAQLVGLVLVRWAPHVTDRAFRVLIRMAHTALDKDDNGRAAGMYYGGRDLLVMTLRAERGGTEEAAYRTVRRALVELVKVGAVERVVEAKRGTNGVYRLRLESAPKVGEPRSPETAIADSGDREEMDSGLHGSELRTPADPPRNHEEPPNPQEDTEEEIVDLPAQVAVAHARSPAKGNGFCLVCYGAGETTLAVDEVSGSACKTHINVIPLRRTA